MTWHGTSRCLCCVFLCLLSSHTAPANPQSTGMNIVCLSFQSLVVSFLVRYFSYYWLVAYAWLVWLICASLFNVAYLAKYVYIQWQCIAFSYWFPSDLRADLSQERLTSAVELLRRTVLSLKEERTQLLREDVVSNEHGDLGTQLSPLACVAFTRWQAWLINFVEFPFGGCVLVVLNLNT